MDGLKELLDKFLEEFFVVTEFFEDVEDDRRPYVAGAMYPALGAPRPSAERIRVLTSARNNRGRPVLLKLQPEFAEQLATCLAPKAEQQAATPDEAGAKAEEKTDTEEPEPEPAPPGDEEPPDAPPPEKPARRKKTGADDGAAAPAT